MNTPSATDLRRLLDLVYDLDGGPENHLARMGAILGSDITSLSTVDHVEGRLVAARSTPDESNLFRVSSFHRVFTQHPGFAAFRAGTLRPGTPAAWSDVNTLRELRRNPLYVDFFAPRGTRDQLVCVVRLNRREGHLLSSTVPAAAGPAGTAPWSSSCPPTSAAPWLAAPRPPGCAGP